MGLHDAFHGDLNAMLDDAQCRQAVSGRPEWVFRMGVEGGAVDFFRQWNGEDTMCSCGTNTLTGTRLKSPTRQQKVIR